MTDLEHDPIEAIFAEFRTREAPMLTPTGMATVRAVVQHRRKVRMITLAVVTAVAIAVPTAAFAVFDEGRGGMPYPGVVSLGPTVSPDRTSSTPVPSSIPPDPSAAPDAVTAPPRPGSVVPSRPPANGRPPAAGRTPSPAGACRSDQLAASVTGGGAMASSPFVVIALTNTSGVRCQLTGYPGITATGHTGDGTGPAGRLSIALHDGGLYERSDPGPHRIDLATGAAASFALGTGTAYDALYTIDQVRVTVPGGGAGIPVTIDLAAGAPSGQPIPVTVTAFGAAAP